MRMTGIVRRIDDLGRVVIPKEIRRNLGIKEGDPLEISVDSARGMVAFTKYCPEIIDKNDLLDKFALLDGEEQKELLVDLLEVWGENNLPIPKELKK